MVTVIIPALNEEKTIAAVGKFSYSRSIVNEVIVVDDNSEDATLLRASAAGAKIISSQIRGKGISMKEGVAAARNECIVFLDGDIDPYPDTTIERLAQPILRGEADFVKGTFNRNAGRVTELVAKPLLSIFFPGIAAFKQPLGGMICGRKSLLTHVHFSNDYGVDISLLLDMYLMKANIKEVDIGGHIENKSKTWEALGPMSREVSKAIISKAFPLASSPQHISALQSIEQINRGLQEGLRAHLEHRRLAVFDMDNTILQGHFIDACAQRFGFTAHLQEIREDEKDPIIRTKRIALLLKNLTMDQLLNVVHGIEMVKDIKQVIKELQQRNYITGIITHSYSLIANYVMNNTGMDFCIAHQLEFFEGKATGEVNTPSCFFADPGSLCGHGFCKTNVLQYLCESYQVSPEGCMAIADGFEDRCMIGHAGKGIAFCTKDELLKKIAWKHLEEKSFLPLVSWADAVQ